MIFKSGYIPSPKDDRDYRFRAYNALHDLPRKFSRPVIHLKDQGRLGSCVGFASSYCKDEQEFRNHGRKYETSPLYVYHQCKLNDGIPHIEGTYIRTANKVVQKYGVCMEPTYPYSDKLPMEPIPDMAHTEALKYKIRGYTAISNLHELKQGLVDHGYPVMGVLVLSSFLAPEVGPEGAFIPKQSGYILGGHAISMIGYDDDLEFRYSDGRIYKGMAKFVNSWYDDRRWWGDNGTAWIPYEVMFSDIASDLPGLATLVEAWTWQDEITKVEPANEIIMTIGDDLAIVDGVEVTIDQPPVIDPDSNRTLIPVRFMAENAGYRVLWEPDTRRIIMRRD